MSRIAPVPNALPAVIVQYLGAPRRDAALLDCCFTEDAVIMDRGTLYKGRDSMLAWQDELAQHYPGRKFEILKVLKGKVADEYNVRVRVTGPFPGGSSMLFVFKFRLRGADCGVGDCLVVAVAHRARQTVSTR